MTAETPITFFTPAVLIALISTLPPTILAIAGLVQASKARKEATAAKADAEQAKSVAAQAKVIVLRSMRETL